MLEPWRELFPNHYYYYWGKAALQYCVTLKNCLEIQLIFEVSITLFSLLC